jgi:hypothetical protein
MTKLKNSNCDKIKTKQKKTSFRKINKSFNFWPNSQIILWQTQKNPIVTKLQTQIMTVVLVTVTVVTVVIVTYFSKKKNLGMGKKKNSKLSTFCG